MQMAYCSAILSHCFQVKGAGFPGNITVPKVMVKPMIKRLKTYKNVIILRFHSVNATSTSAGVSWRLRCIERLILVVSSRDSYRYGDLNLIPVYPAAALKFQIREIPDPEKLIGDTLKKSFSISHSVWFEDSLYLWVSKLVSTYFKPGTPNVKR